VTSTQQTTCSQRCADLLGFRQRFATPTPGREQPSGPASGRHGPLNRGVAHAPALSVTPAKCVSCAAQNAALVVLPLRVQVVGMERLAREALADTGSSIIGFDRQLSVPELRQPPLFVAAPLPASAVSESSSENQGGKALRKPRRSTSEMPPGSHRFVAQVFARRRGARTPCKRGVSDLGCGRGHDRKRGQTSWSLTPRSPRCAAMTLGRRAVGSTRRPRVRDEKPPSHTYLQRPTEKH
jgi:hypothetical protein